MISNSKVAIAVLLAATGACLGQYSPPTGGGGGTIPKTTAVLKGDNAGNATAASAGTDYVAPAGNAATATALAATPNQCGTNNFATGIAASGNANCSQPGFSNLSGAASAGQLPTNVRVRGFGATFDGGGSALTSGKTYFVTIPFSCAISAWNIAVDIGTATVDVWKVATGTAIPTVSNTITASAQPVISTGTAIHSTTLTGWTTAVSANDIVGINLKTVSSATLVSVGVECDQ
jgi:hypothetical protein